MGRPVVLTKALVAAVVNNLALSQPLAGAGNLTLNGAAAGVLDTQRRVLITSAGNDAGLTWTVIGTNDGGAPIRDQFAGANGAVASNLDFKTVTQVSASGATASTVTVGTNTVGSTPWQRFDPHLTPPYLDLVCQLLSGAATGQIEWTPDEFLAGPGAQPSVVNGPATFNPYAILHPQLQGLAASANGAIDWTICGWRWTTLTGTGTWKVTGTQAGLASP
jgi:hypothetical protein